MRCRILLFVFLSIAAVITLVAHKGNWSCLSRQSHSEKRGVTDVVREHAHSTGRMSTGRPVSIVVRNPSVQISNASRADLRKSAPAGNGREQEARRLASEKNQVMDELLARPDIPSDYGAEMVALYRDRAQDVYTRDFAVQHIGLYAETLNRRGTYDPASREAGELRKTLWAASDETGTIVATAAFRALADLAAFDPKVDVRRLDTRLVSCAGDASASSAARVMAVQLCGERGIAASRPLLRRVLSIQRGLVSGPLVSKVFSEGIFEGIFDCSDKTFCLGEGDGGVSPERRRRLRGVHRRRLVQGAGVLREGDGLLRQRLVRSSRQTGRRPLSPQRGRRRRLVRFPPNRRAWTCGG